MATPPEAGHLPQACLVLVYELTEPLTAIANYLELAARLHGADGPAARRQLIEVVKKSERQAARANQTLRQLRDLLRDVQGAGPRLGASTNVEVPHAAAGATARRIPPVPPGSREGSDSGN